MDKFSLVRNGISRLPPGFRFLPTDEEIVFQYLKCKVFSCPLPASIIPEINIYKFEPWDLPGGFGEDRYFFSRREAKYKNGNRANRATNSGYWKATGSDRKILSSGSNSIAGMKKTLVFYMGKPSCGSRTDWTMHEYRLVSAETTGVHNSSQSFLDQMNNWVLCRIFLKKRIPTNENEDQDEIVDSNKGSVVGGYGVAQPRLHDFMMVNESHLCRVSSWPPSASCSSSCSSSSGITESSPRGNDLEESSDSSNF